MTEKAPRHTLSAVAAVTLLAMAVLSASCGGPRQGAGTFRNPIFEHSSNTSVSFFDGLYYYLFNEGGKIYIRSAADPTQLQYADSALACAVTEQYGLHHMRRPQLTRIAGVWYIHVSADNGDTDNQHIYVFENHLEDPMQGRFGMRSRIVTDTADSWAMHANVFRHGEGLYMVWSGWEARRVSAETQCIYIAEMENPWTLKSERVKISEPEHEWERQWVNSDGVKMRYPVYVNESPFFFDAPGSDKVRVYYSASATWTVYCCVGELSADRNADLLNASSWTKSPGPVFVGDAENGVYGPGQPFVIPSPDGTEYFLLYRARQAAEAPFSKENPPTVRAHKIDFESGEPVLGIPEPLSKTLKKPSGLKPKTK